MDGTPDSIVEREGRRFVEVQGGERYVPLMQVFDHYEVRNLDAADVAETLGVDETDVRRSISYWRSSEEVYSELEASVGNFSSEDHIHGAAELAGGEYSRTDMPRSTPREQEEQLENLSQEVREGFEEIFEDTGLSGSDLEESPDERVLPESSSEVHFYWERRDTDLGVYAGVREDRGLYSGLVSYSVDGEMGPVLEVDTGEMEDAVKEMYRNAVFGALE